MTKKLWVGLFLATVVVAMGSGIGYASMPSLLGPTGVVATPNALVAPRGQLQVVVDYMKLDTLAVDVYEEDMVSDENSLWGVEALYGIFDGAELWAAYSKDNGDFSQKTWSAGAKYQFSMPKSNLNLALGANYYKSTGSAEALVWFDPFDFNWVYSDQFDNDIRSWDFYFAATADLTAMSSTQWCGGGRLLGTAGVLYKQLSVDLTDTWAEWYVGPLIGMPAPDWAPDFLGVDSFNVVDDHLVRPFVSLEYFAPSRTSVGVEYRWKDNQFDAKPVFSAVLRQEFTGGFAAAVGITNVNQVGLGVHDHNWFGQVGYTFGCK